MNMSVTYCYAATRVHEAAMSLIRYWFVRSSLQVEVQETFKKDHFIYNIILIPQEYISFWKYSYFSDIYLMLIAHLPIALHFPFPNEIDMLQILLLVHLLPNMPYTREDIENFPMMLTKA